jgi:cytochrome c oxidase subunit 3
VTHPLTDLESEPADGFSGARPAEHFESFEKQEHAAHLGMWLFLTSETLLFGALFGLYAGYRFEYGSEFVAAARRNDALLGTINTVLLVSSSFFAAWAVRAVTRGERRVAVGSLLATLTLGLGFLAIKSIEYSEHIHHGILPGRLYTYPELASEGAKIFFTLYYFMTGLHAAHVIGGLVALVVLAVLVARGRYSPERYTPVELGVLYWHLVDVIWIFLWPLMYLAG